jgi:hypothetical protein
LPLQELQLLQPLARGFDRPLADFEDLGNPRGFTEALGATLSLTVIETAQQMA